MVEQDGPAWYSDFINHAQTFAQNPGGSGTAIAAAFSGAKSARADDSRLDKNRQTDQDLDHDGELVRARVRRPAYGQRPAIRYARRNGCPPLAATWVAGQGG